MLAPEMLPDKLIIQRLSEKIADGWVLTSIEKILKAGVMEDGVYYKTTEGTPCLLILSDIL